MAGCCSHRGAGLEAPVSVAGLGAPAQPRQASGGSPRASRAGLGAPVSGPLDSLLQRSRAAPSDLRPNEALKLSGDCYGLVAAPPPHYENRLQLSAGR